MRPIIFCILQNFFIICSSPRSYVAGDNNCKKNGSMAIDVNAELFEVLPASLMAAPDAPLPVDPVGRVFLTTH
jgi:hypothetical protein